MSFPLCLSSVNNGTMSMNNTRQQLFYWQQQGHIDDATINKALELTQSNPTGQQWQSFIGQLLLWLGLMTIAIGTIFFFAYNWASLSDLQKFALIQGLLIISTIVYTQTKPQSVTNTAILFFLALLIGALFALFGQTYQTGKDPWQLFLIWTLFITPLALTSRSSSLWLLWLGLANLTLLLFFETRHGLFGIMLQNEKRLLAYAFLNLIPAVAFEFFYLKKLMTNRIASQVALIVAMIAFTWVSIYSIFEIFDTSNKGLDLIVYLIWMTGVYYFYRVKTIDVLILSSWLVSGIVFILTLLARGIGNNFNEGTFLLMALLLIALSTAGVKWLLKLLKQVNTNDLAQGETS